MILKLGRPKDDRIFLLYLLHEKKYYSYYSYPILYFLEIILKMGFHPQHMDALQKKIIGNYIRVIIQTEGFDAINYFGNRLKKILI